MHGHKECVHVSSGRLITQGSGLLQDALLVQHPNFAAVLYTCNSSDNLWYTNVLHIVPGIVSAASQKKAAEERSKASASYSLCDAVQHGCSMLCLTWQNAWNWRAALLCPHMPVIDGFAESQERSPGPT